MRRPNFIPVVIFFVAIASTTTFCSCCQTPPEQQQTDPDPDPDPEPDPDPDPDPIKITLSSLLDEMISTDGLTRFPAVAYQSRQESSRDRRSVSPDDPMWFVNDDGWGYERFDFPSGRVEKVIFDEQHPGVITRIWLTSFGSPKTIIRFYFDGASEPSWQVDSYNLRQFATSANVVIGNGLSMPDGEWVRGSVLYLPIPYAKSCKITIEELVEATTVSRYYHINYRRYADGVDFETFSDEVLKANAQKIAAVGGELLNPVPYISQSVVNDATLESGASVAVELPEGAFALTELVVDVSVEQSSLLQSTLQGLVIEGIFDGNRTVALPLVELSGSGRGGYYTKSWRFSVNGRGKSTVRWQMPYQQSARLVIHNTSEYAASVATSVGVAPYAWDSNSLYFHAAYRTADVPIRYWSDYANGYEWNFASISGGRGVYAGDVYTINNDTNQWPGEGDEKIWVDDETFPSHFGTGVEDYYSFCGYFRFNSPFSGEPRLDNSNFHGINTHYRTRNLDVIPFDKSLRFDLEMEGHEAGAARVESAIFWYGEASTTLLGAVDYNFNHDKQ